MVAGVSGRGAADPDSHGARAQRRRADRGGEDSRSAGAARDHARGSIPHGDRRRRRARRAAVGRAGLSLAATSARSRFRDRPPGSWISGDASGARRKRRARSSSPANGAAAPSSRRWSARCRAPTSACVRSISSSIFRGGRSPRARSRCSWPRCASRAASPRCSTCGRPNSSSTAPPARSSTLEREIEQQENFLSVLVGGNPGPIARGRALTDQPHAPDVPAGLPSALLERRPDIQQAEQQLVAANAQIGVARSAYFPQIALTGSGGFESTALGALFTGTNMIWTAAASATQPVFTAGRTRSQVALAEARREEAMISYQRTIRQAFRDVSDALVGYRKLREFRDAAGAVVRRRTGRAAPRRDPLSGRRDQLPRGARRRHAALRRRARARAGRIERALRARRALSGARRRLAAPSCSSPWPRPAAFATHIEAMFRGEKINTTEERAVLHVALRAPRRVDRLRRRQRRAPGARGARSDGGVFEPGAHRGLAGPHRPARAHRHQHRDRRIRSRPGHGLRGAEALQRADLSFRFVSNVDGTDFAEATRDLDPAETAVHRLVEDLHHARDDGQRARPRASGRSTGLGDERAISRHFVAVSTNAERGRGLRHRHGEHVRVLGLGRRALLDGLGDRVVDHDRHRPGALPRHARRLPRDGRAFPHGAVRAQPAGADGPAHGLVHQLLRRADRGRAALRPVPEALPRRISSS